jgi:tetratricopeptide (TPR) repeat protein
MAKNERGHGSSSGGEHRKLEDLLALYLGRLNDGEALDSDRILADHPDLGEEILRDLEAFVGMTGEGDTDEPLGTLGDYTLKRQIGRGGMGVVYEAWQGSLERRVALKVLPAGIAAENCAFLRFMKEAKIAAQLHHPNVVAVYGMGVEQNTPYFAMEYVEGETLAQVLARVEDAAPDAETPFGKKDSIVYFGKLAEAFADVADGLQHAHAKKVIHRDIKPSNLILDREGRLRILDFGLARLEGQESLTLSGDFLGTPQYMSPEQARRKKIDVDHRTDVYSLGATMYEALCGRPPFRGKDHADTLSQIIERDPVEPRKINARVPKELETIVLKCLRKEAGDRYGTAEALGQDLTRFVRGEVIEARPQAAWEKLARNFWRQKARTAVAALALFASAAGVALYRAHRGEVRAASEAKVRTAVMQLRLGKSWLGSRHDYHTLDYPAALIAEVDRGLRNLDEAESHLSRSPAIPYHRAHGYIILKRLSEASKELDRSLRSDPRFVPARVLKALVLGWRGDMEAAELELLRAEEDGQSGWMRTWLEVHRATEERGWRDAAARLGELIEHERANGELFLGSSVETRIGQGIARIELGDYHRAIEDFAQAELLWPESVEPTLLKGKAYYLLGKRDIAEELFEKALAGPNAGRATAILVQAFCAQVIKDLPSALRWAERNVRLYPDDPYMHNELGNRLHNLGGPQDAERAYRKAISLDSGFAWARTNLGLAFKDQGKPIEAFDAFCDSISIDSRFDYPVARSYLLEVLREHGEELRAGGRLRRFRDVLQGAFPSGDCEPYFLNLLALAQARDDSEDERSRSIETIHLAFEKAGRRDANLLLTAAEAYSACGHPREAVLALEELSLLPEAMRVHGERLEDYRAALLPCLASFASVDNALAGCGDDVVCQTNLRERLPPPTCLESSLGDYLEGRLLQMAGRHADAAARFAPIAKTETSLAEPFLRLAESLRDAGETSAAERGLRSAIANGFATNQRLLESWVILCLEDLRQTPGAVLAGWPLRGAKAGPRPLRSRPSDVPEEYADDLRWLLERLEAGDPVRINCGGGDYRAPDGIRWGRDRFFTAGVAAEPYAGAVGGTDLDPLYQSERYFPPGAGGANGYRLPLPSGHYRLTLHFAEVYHRETGERRFEVLVEDDRVLPEYEPLQAGFATAEVKPFVVDVRDGRLDLVFVVVAGCPKVSAIEVERFK